MRNLVTGCWFAGFFLWHRRLAGANALAGAALLLGVPANLQAQSITVTEYATPSSSYPDAITRGPDGALWFIEGSGRIGRITLEGTVTEYTTQAVSLVSIVAGADQALWFTEWDRYSIGRITASGVITEYAVPSDGHPYGITAGPDGALWFVEGSGKVGRITTAGVITEYPANGGGTPQNITVGPDGALWFTAIGQIGRFDSSGTATFYTVPTPYAFPQCITAGPDGALWFTEYGGNQIGRITTSGKFTEYAIPTANSNPEGITTGPDGALWFTESGAEANRIGRITTAGLFNEYQLPAYGEPSSITVGQDGALWFTESSTGKIGRAVLAPQIPGNVTVGSVPPGLTVTVDGTTYTGSVTFNWTAGESHSIGVPASRELGGGGTRYAFGAWSDGGAQSHNITVPPSATTYTATFTPQYLLVTGVSPSGGGIVSVNPSSPDGFYNSGTLLRLTATANPGFRFSNWSSDLSGSTNPQSVTIEASYSVQANFIGATQSISFSNYPTPTPFSSPYGIAAGPDGALWFTEAAGNKIGRITVAGVITEYAVPSGSPPRDIVTGRDGALWFTEPAKIGRITTDGAITEFPIPGSGSGIAAGPDGSLWFADSSNGIGRITLAGAITELPIPTGSIPDDIATGPDGALWFTEAAGNKIGRITTGGTVTEFSVPTPSSSPFSSIAAGPDGALWFTEATANKVGRITAAGVVTEFTIPTAISLDLGGITPGPDGALWFTQVLTHALGRINTAGVITTYPFDGGPFMITAGPDGALWFTANGNSIGRAVLPTGNPCTYSLPQAGQAFSSYGGIGSATVRAPAGGPGGCTWTATSSVPWLTITDGSGGAGNGTVSYAVAANPSAVSRTGTLTIANQTYTVTQAGSTSTPSCTGSVPLEPEVAIEGRTELLGDYLLSCTGLSGTMKADITLTLNTNVTNALSSGATDAVMTVNGVSVPQSGVVAGFNSILWTGVSLTPAGNGTVSVRISKVRADASQLLTQRIVANPGNPQPTAVTGQLSISTSVAVPVSNAVQVMANAVQTLVFTEQPPNPAAGASQTTIPMVFQEAQAISFTPGATRLYLSLSNVPATVQVYASVSNVDVGSQAQLYSADANGVGGSPLAGIQLAGGMYQLLITNGGTVTATWVVLAANPAVIDTYTFPLLVLNAASGDLSQMQVAASLAPVSGVGVASATAPVPRYRNLSVQPNLANLRISTSVQMQGQGAAASLQPLERAEASLGPDASGSGLIALFSHQVVNDTSDPNQTATNVVINDTLPSGLTLISCAAAGASCSGSGNQVQVNVGMLGPGQSATMTVAAQVDPSYTGAVENPVSASSDEVNLDLLASTSSSSFIVGGVPVTVAANPASGSGNAESFTFQFSDPSGYQNLGVVNVLINSVLDGRNACYLAYVVPSQTLYLVDDGGDAGGPYAGSIPLGGSGTIQNSQCAVGLTSVVGSGSTLTLTLNITFQAGFGGNKVAFVAAGDQSQVNSGWQALGVWQVPWTPAGSIAATGVTPTHGAAAAGSNQQFNFTWTDSKGAGDFGIVDVLINQFIDGRKACYLAYVAATETLVLVDDGGDAGGPWAGSMVLNGGSGAISNSQCSVSGAGSTVGYAPYTMTLTLNITFTAAFNGNRVFYVAGRDPAGGNNTGWQAVGTWTVQ
jgi:streptogramin lyase